MKVLIVDYTRAGPSGHAVHRALPERDQHRQNARAAPGNAIEQGNANAKLGLVLRALNELQIDLTACACTSMSQHIETPEEDDIDIDAIVDQPPPGGADA